MSRSNCQELHLTHSCEPTVHWLSISLILSNDRKWVDLLSVESLEGERGEGVQIEKRPFRSLGRLYQQ